MERLFNGFNNGRDTTEGIGGIKPIDWDKIRKNRRLNVEKFLNNKTMEQYLGVKLISAEPCSQDQFAGAVNKGDLSKLHGGVDVDGYKVVYEGGYTSWSPRDVFEKAYRKFKSREDMLGGTYQEGSYQERVFLEMCDLDEKVYKLNEFIEYNKAYPQIDEAEQIRLKQQSMAMQYYLTILVERIENF